MNDLTTDEEGKLTDFIKNSDYKIFIIVMLLSFLKKPITRQTQIFCYKENIKKLNKIYYTCNDLSSSELRILVNNRRLQFSQMDDYMELIIYPEIWETDDIVWDGISEILNVWSVGDQVREKIIPLLDDTHVIKLILDNSDY